ncbi:MAG TPA: hypothetical protein VIR54_21655, partial [Vicinamibacterales bacterium]
MKGVLVAALLMCATVASAQDLGKQTVNFTLGYFTPLGFDSRDIDDVLIANSTFLQTRGRSFLDLDEFNGASVGGEWLFPLARHIEGGIGVSYTSQTSHTVYADFVDPDGTEIDQDLKLRLTPIAFTVRLIPVSPRSPFQPYIGGGVGLISWKYTEVGEFVDFNAGREIFNGNFEESGTNAGPVFLGGIRFAGDAFSTGFEIRYQHAKGDLGSDFAAPKIDLG